MRVPPAETPTLFARRGPGGRIVVEAIQDGSGYDCDGEALEARSSSRKAKGCLHIYDVTETPTSGKRSDQRFAHRYGYWRPAIAEVVEKYLARGILEHGFARVRCGVCKHGYLLAFSCKCRYFCPSCHAKGV